MVVGQAVRLYTAKATGRMNAPRPLRILCVIALSVIACSASELNSEATRQQNDLETKKLELYDGVYLKIPHGNSTEKLMSFEIDARRNFEEGRGKKKKQKLLEKILPLFIMPFLIQSAIVPLFLSMLKFMLFKSLIVGKVALALIIINAFRNHNTFKGRDAEMADIHYGYHGNGMEEYGAYVN